MIKRVKFIRSLEVKMFFNALVAAIVSAGIIALVSRVSEGPLRYIAAIGLACLAFISVMLLYTGKLTARIIRLVHDAETIGEGDLEHPICTEGDDELSVLGQEMDNMRRSVIERLGSESRAWQANSELITAISHDIRTPMTALIGYLGLIRSGGFEDQAQLQQFANSAYDKAIELKDLTDELFKYFLAFGKAELELNAEYMDAKILLSQMISEAEFELKEAGLSVQRISTDEDCTVFADPLYLKRVIDNLVSNAKKYADRLRPVVIVSELADGELSICISNSKMASTEHKESTKIGIQTCVKIMQAMGGSFHTISDEEHYAAELKLPTVEPPKA